MDILFYLFGLAIFVCVVLALEGAYLLWSARRSPEARRLERRLKGIVGAAQAVAGNSSIYKHRLLSETPALHELLLRIPGLDELLLQSGSAMNVGRFFALSAGCAVAGFIGTGLFHVRTLACVLAAAVLS